MTPAEIPVQKVPIGVATMYKSPFDISFKADDDFLILK
jgi:hypothetical protein